MGKVYTYLLYQFFILGVITLYEEEVLFTRILVYFIGFIILNAYFVSLSVDSNKDSVLRLVFDDNSNIGIIGAFAYEFLIKIKYICKK